MTMRYEMHRALRLPLILGFATLALQGCAGGTVIVATPSACASLLPNSWKDGVAGAPLPDGDTVADWVSFGDAQTAQLDKANGRTSDAIGIVERCEARDASAVKAARHKTLGIF